MEYMIRDQRIQLGKQFGGQRQWMFDLRTGTNYHRFQVVGRIQINEGRNYGYPM